VKDLEVKRSVVSAAGNLNEEPAAFTFLLGISKNDPDVESRRVAVRQLGRFKRDDAADEIIKIYKSDVNLDVKRSALRALADTKNREYNRCCWISHGTTQTPNYVDRRFAFLVNVVNPRSMTS